MKELYRRSKIHFWVRIAEEETTKRNFEKYGGLGLNPDQNLILVRNVMRELVVNHPEIFWLEYERDHISEEDMDSLLFLA